MATPTELYVLFEPGSSILQTGGGPVTLELIVVAILVAGVAAYFSYAARNAIPEQADELREVVGNLETTIDELQALALDLEKIGEPNENLEKLVEIDRTSEEMASDLQAVESRLEALSSIEETVGNVESRLSTLDDLQADLTEIQTVDDRIDGVEARIDEVQAELGDVVDTQTIKQPLINIDDRLAQLDDRLTNLRTSGVSAENDIGDALSAIDSEISAIDERLGEIERRIEAGGDGTGSTGGVSADSDTSGFMTGDDGGELDDVEDEFDFDEELLGIDDEEDTA